MIDQPLRHDRSSRSRSLLRRHCGLLLLLAILLPLRLERARLESSIWIDETYSFLLAQKPVLKIFDFLTVDPNPPGYFLALKAWLEAVRMVAGEPGVLAARLLSCLGWVLLAAISWFGGERLLGRRGGALLAASVSGSGYAALFAKDARGYSLASVSLFACFVALSLLYCGREEGSGRPGLLWAFYAAAAEVALWTHALSGIAILFLFIFWLASLRGAKRRAPGYLAGGATAHLAIVFLFLPWVIHLARQSSYYMQAIQGFANPSFSSFQKVVSIDAGIPANSDNLWNAQANYRGDSGFDVFTAAGGESVPNLSIALGGLRSGLTYNVYGRYATAPAGSGDGIAMGLSTLTRYDETNTNHTVIRNFGNWQEWEVLLGQATVAGGQITLQIGIGTIPSSAAWTGARLSLASPLAVGHFYTLAPCRILDTRTTGGHLTSTSTSPSFYSVVGACGVPVVATAVSLNLTGVGATGNAFLHFFPGNLTSSAASVVAIGPESRATRAAMAVLELATDGSGTLGVMQEFTSAGQVDLLIDVDGYFAP